MIKIGIIGLGNMGQAIAYNLKQSKKYKLYYFDKSNKKEKIAHFCNSIKELIKKSEVIILSVKPQNFSEIEPYLEKYTNKKHLIISIMAGISLKSLSKNVKTKNIIRSMPNLALKEKASLTGWKAYEKCSKKAIKISKDVFSLWGVEVECKQENQLNTITAAAGSGPAYFLLIADIIYKFLTENKFSKEKADKITKKVFEGSYLHYSKQNLTPEKIIEKITSKGGTTETAFKYLKKHKIREKILNGIKKAQKRSKELEI